MGSIAKVEHLHQSHEGRNADYIKFPYSYVERCICSEGIALHSKRSGASHSMNVDTRSVP